MTEGMSQEKQDTVYSRDGLRRKLARDLLQIARTAMFELFMREMKPTKTTRIVEHHTSVPFLHYIPTAFRWALSGTTLGYWSEPKNLEFLDASSLRADWPATDLPKIVPTGVGVGMFKSNLAVIATGRRPD